MLKLSEAEKNIDELKSLHMDFWNHTLEKPIINDRYSLWGRTVNLINVADSDKPSGADPQVLHSDWIKKEETVLEPDMIIPERHHKFYEYDNFGDSPIIGPVFNTIIPWTLITWLPGIAGCKIIASRRGKTIWPEPYIEKNWYKDKDLGLKLNWQWLDKLIQFILYLVKKYYPKRMISPDLIARGPGDILLSAMDFETAYTSMYDHPEELKKLISRLADIYIVWAEKQLEVIPEFEKGYCNQYGLWAPGTVSRIQEDFAINLSEEHFKEFILPADEKAINAIEYQVFHTHSGSPKIAQWASKIEGLKAVEVSLDPFAPTLEELLPIWKEVSSKKSMIITGTLRKNELDYLISNLDCSGLLFDILIRNN